jgi:hypothetical protein
VGFMGLRLPVFAQRSAWSAAPRNTGCTALHSSGAAIALERQQTGCGDIPVFSTLHIWVVAWRAVVGYTHAMLVA